MSETEDTIFPFITESIHAEEVLIRILYHPDHIDDSGKMKPSAISREDLEVRGFSVDRKKYANRMFIENNIETYLARKEGRSLSSFGLIKHEVVLNIKDMNNNTAFNVKADPLVDNPAHAIILLQTQHQPSDVKKLRKALIDEFNYAKNLDEALR